jgi:CheY-like chemotaxis protein
MNKSVYMLEDDGDDRTLTRQMMEELGLSYQLHFFYNSNDLLNAIKVHAPSLILLDYNSSPENGISILKTIKADAQLATIPVVILGDSDQPFFREECYRAGASSLIRKPVTIEGTRKKIGTFFQYWFEVAEVGELQVEEA